MTKPVLKEIKDLHKQKSRHGHELIIDKMEILFKLVSTISIKISSGFFPEIYKLTLKFKWKCKEDRIVKTILKKGEC